MSLPDHWAMHEYPDGVPQKYRVDGPDGLHVFAVKLDRTKRGFQYQLWRGKKRIGTPKETIEAAIELSNGG